MDLLVVGTGAAYPDRPGTASSCYVVRHGDASLCLDLGQGSFAGLAGRLEPSSLRAVVISHLHPDHFIDLVALRHYLRYEFEPPRRMRVVAPAGLEARLDGATGEPGFAAQVLDIEDRVPGLLEIGPFAIESRRVTHTSDAHATRVTLVGDAPGALVFSGDCGRWEDLAPLVREGDVLLTEVAFGPGPVPAPDVHLDGLAVGSLAATSGPARVLLTHLQMQRDAEATLREVRAQYGGPVDFVRDGDVIPL